MKLKVESDVVRRNIELFKVLLKKSSQQTTSNQELQDKIYQAFIHKKSGELRFSEVSPEMTSHELSLWRPLSFKVFTNPTRKEKLECELIEGSLSSSEAGMQLEALQVLKETVKTIQLISRLLPKIQNLPRLFLEFSQVHLEAAEPIRSKVDIIHDAWHQIDRLQTEALLEEKEVGTFLFRKDEYAVILEEQLKNAHDGYIKCITLSYLDADKKICDLTLVKTDQGWLVYNDDPNLIEPTYPDIDVFFDNMKGILRSPLTS